MCHLHLIGRELYRMAALSGEPTEAFVGDVDLMPVDAGWERGALKLLPILVEGFGAALGRAG